MKLVFFRLFVVVVLLLTLPAAGLVAVPDNKPIGINVVLKTRVTPAIVADLGKYGKVRDVVDRINAVAMQAATSALPAIQALPYVAAANPDAVRTGRPVDTVLVDHFAGGLNTWNLDAVNVTDWGVGRTIGYDGTGVYVAVLDTGLVSLWRAYFPEERIAAQYAVAFGGGGGDVGTVSQQPDKWQRDTDSHGTHVTSTILGYSLYGVPFNGVAPKATVIPVKVLNQAGWGWSSVIARGIMYVTELKTALNVPMVINMSLVGPAMDAMEKAAIDCAISQGVIVVASAGNEGEAGMGYPGAYPPVISVAASGWVGEWQPVFNPAWWYGLNVADPVNPDHFYITDFSSRAETGQDLDVAAPGSWVAGPYQTNSGQISYYLLGGTSMATPHVTGIVALMLQKKPSLTAVDVESILETSAIYLAPGCRTVFDPSKGGYFNFCWSADATGAGLITADGALSTTP